MLSVEPGGRGSLCPILCRGASANPIKSKLPWIEVRGVAGVWCDVQGAEGWLTDYTPWRLDYSYYSVGALCVCRHTAIHRSRGMMMCNEVWCDSENMTIAFADQIYPQFLVAEGIFVFSRWERA